MLWIAAVGGTTAFLWLLPSPMPRFWMPDGDAAPNVTVKTGVSASDG